MMGRLDYIGFTILEIKIQLLFMLHTGNSRQMHAKTLKFSEDLTSTYFDGTVKVLMEALSCIETKHLNL